MSQKQKMGKMREEPKESGGEEREDKRGDKEKQKEVGKERRRRKKEEDGLKKIRKRSEWTEKAKKTWGRKGERE